MNTRTRIALLLVGYSVIILTLFGVSVFMFQNNYAYRDFYKRLETRATIAARYNLNPDTLNAESYRVIRERHLERLDQEKEYILLIGDSTSTQQLAEAHKIPSQLVQDIMRNGTSMAQRGTTFYAGVKVDANGQQYAVVVSANNYYINHHLSFLGRILGVGILLSSIIVIYLSLYFSKHVFDPIKQITNRVKHISTENIYLRVEEKDYKYEIGELTSTFNDLLNRIETTLGIQKNFISNASHELATPLTSIIGEAEVTLKRERTVGEYQQSLAVILVQAERLNEIMRSLLSLAQVGYKGEKLIFDVVRADELIWEVKAMIDKLNPDNNIQVELGFLPEDPRKLRINGNRQLLQIALVNLLNNACKYSHNKLVSVHIAAIEKQLILVIIDRGIGIPEEEVKFIYDPFFRASNSLLFEGYGIGLPLARNIITLHNGVLNITSTVNVGTTVKIKIPSVS